MKNLNIELLHYTPINVPIKAVSMPYKKDNANPDLLKKVIKVLKHESVAEHINISFFIDGVSRSELQDHMRHRIASTTCESTRYTLRDILNELNKLSENKYGDILEDYFVTPILPEAKTKADHLNNCYFMEKLRHLQQLSIEYMKELKGCGFSSDHLKSFLLESYKTRFVWTINLRSLKNFLHLRDAENAHFEISNVARTIKESLRDTYIWELL